MADPRRDLTAAYGLLDEETQGGTVITGNVRTRTHNRLAQLGLSLEVAASMEDEELLSIPWFGVGMVEAVRLMASGDDWTSTHWQRGKWSRDRRRG